MNNIKHYRQKAGMTQGDLADVIGQRQASISNYEKGIRQPDIETSKKIAAALRVTLDELFQVSAA